MFIIQIVVIICGTVSSFCTIPRDVIVNAPFLSSCWCWDETTFVFAWC